MYTWVNNYYSLCYGLLVSPSESSSPDRIMFSKLHLLFIFCSACMVNSFWQKCSRSPKLLLLSLEYDTDFIFNVNIPEDVRKSYFEKCVQCLNLNEKIAVAIAEKETETAKKETETAKREKTEVEKALSQQLYNIQEITRDNSLMAPRAVIEFVETFVFNKYNVSGSSRSAKWEKFFTDVSIGQRILQCTTKKSPLWSSKAKAIAERISDLPPTTTTRPRWRSRARRSWTSRNLQWCSRPWSSSSVWLSIVNWSWPSDQL